MAEAAVLLQPNVKGALYAAADGILVACTLRGLRAAAWFAVGG